MKQLNGAAIIMVLAALSCGPGGRAVAVAQEFATLQADFQRLWLAENRDNDGYQELVKRFLNTSTPCRAQARALQVGMTHRDPTSTLEKGASTVKEFAANNIHWLGHDSFKLVGQKTVYIDPYKVQTPDQADIICAKQRNGPTGTDTLYFRKDTTQFSNLTRKGVDLAGY